MSLKEVFFRINELVLIYFNRVYFIIFRGRTCKELTFGVNVSESDFGRFINVNGYDRVSKLNFPYFDSQETVFFKKIKFRPGTVSEDIRCYWEKNRFNEVYDRSYHDFKEYFIEWCSRNEPLKGPNYISVMECAIRTINLYLFCSKNSNEVSIDKEMKTLVNQFFCANRVIIENRLSLHSSEGNHTLYEIAALYTIALATNGCSQKFFIKYVDLYLSQTYDDGGSVEQSTGYHLTSLQLTSFVLFISQNNSVVNQLSSYIDLQKRFSLCAEYLSHFKTESNELYRLGDWDNGILFGGRIFLSEYYQEAYMGINSYVKLYPSSGYMILEDQGVKVIQKYGNLGMPPMYGHGHYDSLALALFFNGEPLLYDAATYSYSLDGKLRNVIRSELAQNTPSSVLTSGKQLSPFMWANDYNSSCLEVKNLENWKEFIFQTNAYGNSDFYRRLYFRNNILIILDDTKGDEDFVVRWKIRPDFMRFFGFFKIQKTSMNVSSLRHTYHRIPFSRMYGELEYVDSSVLSTTCDSYIATVLIFSDGPVSDSDHRDALESFIEVYKNEY